MPSGCSLWLRCPDWAARSRKERSRSLQRMSNGAANWCNRPTVPVATVCPVGPTSWRSDPLTCRGHLGTGSRAACPKRRIVSGIVRLSVAGCRRAKSRRSGRLSNRGLDDNWPRHRFTTEVDGYWNVAAAWRVTSEVLARGSRRWPVRSWSPPGTLPGRARHWSLRP